MSDTPRWLQNAREHWQFKGAKRPAFAQQPGEGQESVWDYPRPPVIVPDTREVIIVWGTREVARTRHALRVLETSHPPSFYLPMTDVAQDLLVPASGSSFCEWKGQACYWTLKAVDQELPRVGWSYPRPLAGAERLKNHIAFYPHQLGCTVGGATVTPQAGGFYGGWITPELTGPFKGDAGSQEW
jgi:uncharacterized protein (DUF427 family)